jgi:hypothetical protein
LVWLSLPSRDLGNELEPCRPQVPVVRHGCTDQLVDAVGDSFECSFRRRESFQSCRTDSGLLYLATRHQTPLVLGQFMESAERRWSRHYCIIALKRVSLKYVSSGNTSTTPLNGGFHSKTSVGSHGAFARIEQAVQR